MSTSDDLLWTLPVQLTETLHRDIYDLISPENPANNQQGKIILITGGGSGIGAAAARVWVRAGAEGVVIAGRREDVLQKTAVELTLLGQGKTKILAVPTNIASENDVENLYAEVKKRFGRTADVVIANAGAVPPTKPLAELDINTWWAGYEVNVKGMHNTVVHWIRSQANPKEPEGTFINVSSGLAGIKIPGGSAYGSSKLAGHRYTEYIGLDYPKIRAFTTIPGVVMTDVLKEEEWLHPFAKDAPEMTGGLALYLSSSRADFLKSSLISVNWDLETIEAHKKEVEEGALQAHWIPLLPMAGGKGW
ncbi:uncharacterized protein A1O9_04319 [Exophiala aquamarina CBS 119918]|uniref:Oxidoreductase n=1 Tax=Exophiala aquamarina CBS 119918 TaxID=1182545 RepID=A0A072PV84_9EURO|nr:uncharacterized protein A1O9_04319 [Exophiala aquamarina CBS 119918]KEF59475.1 hypothetical protein A1O9_04319 [Exophiala aquamarina CBS 119918]